MKPALRMMFVFLLAAGGMALPVDDAQAGLTIPEREHVQVISWAVEFLAIFIALAIALFIWRLSKRDRNNRNAKRNEITRD